MAQKSPFLFYKSFFTVDIHELTNDARSALFGLLEKIQLNPYSPRFQGKQEKHGAYYVVEFSPGWVVYWSLETNGNEVERIKVLKVAKVEDVLLGL